MNIRWKAALRFGLAWGILMTGFSILFDIQEKSFHDIITSNGFWLRSLSYTIVGVFPVGYFSVKKAKE